MPDTPAADPSVAQHRPVAVTAARREVGGVEAVVVAWDFAVRGGTFGVAETDAFVEACSAAVAARLPLVTITRTGGTRLQEGMRALVGIPRAALALKDLAEARLPHLCIVDHPTTGGVWVGVCSRADLRVAVAGATVGFSGPRVVEAMTGVSLPPGANTAERALTAGLVDEVVSSVEDAQEWVGRALRVAAAAREAGTAADAEAPSERGWAHVARSRATDRPAGVELLDELLDNALPLRGADGSTVARIGSVRGVSAVVVAAAAQQAGMLSVAGYRLLARAAAVADHLRLPLVTLVDTAGADPLPPSEDAGIAAAIADAMTALLGCASPTIAVVHGAGGSGGALAAATADVVAVTPTGWFAALDPVGAAAALRSTAEQAADAMRVAAVELVEDGFADAIAPADPGALAEWLAWRLATLAGADESQRLDARQRRWRSALDVSVSG